MNDNPYLAPDTVGQSPAWNWEPLKRWGMRLFITACVLGVLFALLMPVPRISRGEVRRIQCTNNLKLIGLALHNYHDEHGEYPPAYTVDAAGKPLHSWRTLILPYMEQGDLYNKIDLTKPWNDPANKVAYETDIRAFSCPSLKLPKGHTNYLALIGEAACFHGAQPRKLSEITDDHGRTLMVVEVSEKRSVHWMQPTDCDEQMLAAVLRDSKLPHSRVVLAARVDGSMLSISEETKPAKLHALITINGDDDRLADE